MRLTKASLHIARGLRWAVLVVLVFTLRLVDPAYAAELQASGSPTSVASLAVTRNNIPFEVVIYRASSEPHLGTVVLLHGFPGGRIGEGFSPRTLSLAVSLAKSGYTVVRFNYIGSWASDGQFSWFGGVLDTEAILRFLRTGEGRSLGIDGSRIALVGHSYGGWVALMTAARDPTVRCVAVMASANMGKTGKVIRDSDEAYKRRVALYEAVLGGPEPPIRAQSAKALADDVIDHAEAWDLVNSIEQLQSKEILFASAQRDELLPMELYVQPLIDGLLRANAPSIRSATVEGADHNFSQHGSQVNDMVETWIKQQCKY